MKTTEQIAEQEAQDTREFEKTTVAFELANGQQVTMAEARDVAERIFDPADWRKPCAAFVPHQIVETAMKALEFYHGAKATVGGIQPITGKVLVESPGYAAW